MAFLVIVNYEFHLPTHQLVCVCFLSLHNLNRLHKGLITRTTNGTSTVFNIHVNRTERLFRKFEGMGLKIEDNYYVHTLLFANDQFEITTGEGNDLYIR
jgi:hypothetical protein